MAKNHSQYVCSECGARFTRWQGKCTECGAWSSLNEEIVEERKMLGMTLSATGSGRSVELDEVTASETARISSGLPEFDRVLGGGLVNGSLVLVGGPPGIGKSTLLLQVAGALGQSHPQVLYVSGEESPQQIRLRAERLGVTSPSKNRKSGIIIYPETGLEAVEAKVNELKPQLVIVDSIQTVFRSDIASAPGSVTQIRECAASLMRLAKTQGCIIIIVGHVTKGGDLAGPRVLEHLVDTVLHFDAQGLHNVRALRSIKNRFGSTQETGFFEMDAQGLKAIPDASSFFLSQRTQGIAGSVVFPSMEGTRPVLVEIQALVAPSYAAEQGVPATRRALGLDHNRLSLLLAVIQKRVNSMGLGLCDVYINVAGGMRLQEPALDLPLVLAVISGRADQEIAGNWAAFGEIGLGGELRTVSGLQERLNELIKQGFRHCLVPKRGLSGFKMPGCYVRGQEHSAQDTLELLPAETVAEALQLAGLNGLKKLRYEGKAKPTERPAFARANGAAFKKIPNNFANTSEDYDEDNSYF